MSGWHEYKKRPRRILYSSRALLFLAAGYFFLLLKPDFGVDLPPLDRLLPEELLRDGLLDLMRLKA